MPQILEKCVTNLKKSGKSEQQAYAICTAQLKKAGKLKGMDKNIAHDIVHKQNKISENCPFCTGKMDNKQIVAEADRLVEENVRRRADMEAPYYFGKAQITTHYDIFEGAEDDDDIPDEIQVLPKGKWNTGQYGEVEITDDHISEMVKNFNDGKRAGVPIDIDHKSEEAVGWVKKLVKKADGLFAKVDWNTKGLQLLGDKAYRFISPEFSFNFKDPLTSDDFGAVLIAATVTNFPLFRNMKAITGNEQVLTNEKLNDNLGLTIFSNENTMDLQDLLKKPQAELTQPEKDFLSQNSAQLTPEQRKTYDLQTTEEKDAETKEAEKAKADKEAEDAKKDEEEKARLTKEEADKKTEDEKLEGKEKKVTLTASEVETLKADAKAGREAAEKLRFNETQAKVEKDYIIGKEGGRILPKAKEPLTKLVHSFNDVQKNLFDEVVKAIPDVKLFKEFGKGEEGESVLKASEKIDVKAKEMIKAEKGLTYSQALGRIETEQPDLYKEYKEETGR